MDKKQLAAVLATGIALGVGGKALLGMSADAAARLPLTHGMDVRREVVREPDGGLSLGETHVRIYGTLLRPDGGVRDVGESVKCDTADDTKRLIHIVMYDLSKMCSYREP